jgi:hypothetical protein
MYFNILFIFFNSYLLRRIWDLKFEIQSQFTVILKLFPLIQLGIY